MMHGQGLARVIVGIVGNVFSLLLFLSPAPTFKRILAGNTTEEFDPFPYLASVMNCIIWIFYGLPMVHPDSTLVVSMNSVGLGLETIYLIILLCYTSKRQRGIIIGFLIGEIVLLATIAAVTLLCFHTQESRSTFVGVICVVCGIIKYAFPLSVIRQVIESQDPGSMPLGICVAGFLNGLVWLGYAFLKQIDVYVAVANGIGTVFATAQLSVHAFFHFKKKQMKVNTERDRAMEMLDMIWN